MHMGAKSLNYSSIYYGYFPVLILLVEILCCSFLASSTSKGPKDMSGASLIRVDQSGKGDYTKIQDAIDSVPSNNSKSFFILVQPGTYRENVVVPADKPFITLGGTEASNTILTWNVGGGLLSSSPALTILASDFVAKYLTIQNTYGKTGIGVALRVSGDRAAFYGCRILSYQDTLLDDGGRHYYKDCYIEGATDFICGNAASLFESCHLHSISGGNGAITAQKRESPSENTGYVFSGCKVTGIGGTVLGRPWGSYSRVIFASTYMSGAIQPEGWNDWGVASNQRTAYYGEYKCYGPGANRDKRVNWSRILTNEEAAPFLDKSMIGGSRWLRMAPTPFRKR